MLSKEKEYVKEYSRKYYLDNKEAIKKYQKEYYKNNGESMKIKNIDANLKKRYGITIDVYNQMFIKQDGKCSICGIHQSELKRALAVDHNHETGKVRGLLCIKCNLALGLVDDSIILLNNLITYLQNN